MRCSLLLIVCLVGTLAMCEVRRVPFMRVHRRAIKAETLEEFQSAEQEWVPLFARWSSMIDIATGILIAYVVVVVAEIAQEAAGEMP